jgi:hypothetical protein
MEFFSWRVNTLICTSQLLTSNTRQMSDHK